MPRKYVTGGAKPPHQRRKPRTGGEFGLRIEEAGAMIGLSRSASYRAANAGEIPTIKAGRVLIVPKAIWLRMLGIEPADDRPARSLPPAAIATTA